MMVANSTPAPVEIGRANQHDIKITWQDRHESLYPARELRLKCPCAGCVDGAPFVSSPRGDIAPKQQSRRSGSPAEADEFTGVIRIIPNHIPQDVHPLSIKLVGNYAITIQWSDGHHTGIYSFEMLRKLCPCCQVKGAR